MFSESADPEMLVTGIAMTQRPIQKCGGQIQFPYQSQINGHWRNVCSNRKSEGNISSWFWGGLYSNKQFFQLISMEKNEQSVMVMHKKLGLRDAFPNTDICLCTYLTLPTANCS